MSSTEKYRRWAPEEVALLEDRAAFSTVRELSDILGRPVKMVRWKIHKLGLTCVDARAFGSGREVSVWTEDRLQYLRESAATVPVEKMASHLGLRTSQVRSALFEHKITGRGYARKHTPEEVDRRVAPLRGRENTPRDQPRECQACGKVAPIHQYPSERKANQVASKLCESCRKLDMTLRRYKITSERWWGMYDAQGGKCLLCFRSFEETRAVIDHDHSCCASGSCGSCVRSLLCQRCNWVVGVREGILADSGYAERLEAYVSQ